ncbi:MAG: RNA polymerase subunit sigma-24, partial [Candidatus Kapaibacterium sp.]
MQVFEEIYKSYWQKIFRLCMGYVNDHNLAQD